MPRKVPYRRVVGVPKERIARKQYSCDNCMVPIFPGDTYLATNVIICGKNWKTEREHNYCPDSEPDGCADSLNLPEDKREEEVEYAAPQRLAA